jgi:hypothetical protein
MNYQTYLSALQDFLGTDQETAERATRAVASVLGERIGADEARVLAAHLPSEVAAWLHTTGGARSFDAEEFVRHVAERPSSGPTAGGPPRRGGLRRRPTSGRGDGHGAGQALDSADHRRLLDTAPTELHDDYPTRALHDPGAMPGFLHRVATIVNQMPGQVRYPAQAVLNARCTAKRQAGPDCPAGGPAPGKHHRYGPPCPP